MQIQPTIDRSFSLLAAGGGDPYYVIACLIALGAAAMIWALLMRAPRH
ncbi:hypothetical protein CNECB9_2540017 [Cupriavidus necator]|uniref:Uncharacterized protein n=1 Tax=Cupriavidus necator TaxID=106590 RepID=A0A1K0JKR7_CUPNE|nr:hypothetical protein CNECB9_2540017 [Cupriavidus necator]